MTRLYAGHHHTPVAQYFEHHWKVTEDHELKSYGPFHGELLRYDGGKQDLIPGIDWPIKSGDQIMVLNFDSSVIAHPEQHVPYMKKALEKVAWDTSNTNAEYIIACSWGGLIKPLVEAAPSFFVVGVLDNKRVMLDMIKEAAESNPTLYESLQFGYFPIIASSSTDLWRSVTGRSLPDMSD
jgi:hypothetical protein